MLTLHSFLFFLAILLSSSERDRTDALRSLGRDNKELFVNEADIQSDAQTVHFFFQIRKTKFILKVSNV